VSSTLGLLDAVSLHDLSVPIDADVPGPPRLGLPVQDGRVGDVVVLKHTLLELALWCEVFLQHTHAWIRSEEKNNTFRVWAIFYRCYYLYIYSPIPQAQLGMGGNGLYISLWQGYRSICGCINKVHTHINKLSPVCADEFLPHGQSDFWAKMP